MEENEQHDYECEGTPCTPLNEQFENCYLAVFDGQEWHPHPDHSTRHCLPGCYPPDDPQKDNEIIDPEFGDCKWRPCICEGNGSGDPVNSGPTAP